MPTPRILGFGVYPSPVCPFLHAFPSFLCKTFDLLEFITVFSIGNKRFCQQQCFRPFLLPFKCQITPFWKKAVICVCILPSSGHTCYCSTVGVSWISNFWVFWTSGPLWGPSLLPPPPPPLSVSPYFCSSLSLFLFFLVPSCSLIKTRLGSQLLEPALEQRRRCSSSWNPHSSSSSSSLDLNGPPLRLLFINSDFCDLLPPVRPGTLHRGCELSVSLSAAAVNAGWSRLVFIQPRQTVWGFR